MKVVVKYSKTEYVNIPADRMEEKDGMVFVYCGEKLKGVFDLSSIDMIYLSGG